MRNLLLSFLVAFALCSCATAPIMPYELTETAPKPRKIENVEIALVLGGGGARGIAHLGVLEVLEENGIPIDLIVGTSAGSIVGAMYADYKDHKLVYDQLIKLKKWDLLDLSFSNSFLLFSHVIGPVQGAYLERFIAKNLSVNYIEELRIPFIAVATDLENEEVYAFESGPVSVGVHASAAIPPVFTPVKAYGRLLVDGGIIEPVPVSVAKRYNPKLIIAVDISIGGKEYPLNNMLDVTQKSMAIAYHRLSQMQASSADVFIHPNLGRFGMFHDGSNEELYQLGKNAALAQLPEILMKMRDKKIIN